MSAKQQKTKFISLRNLKRYHKKAQAKQGEKFIEDTEKGVPNGVATLDEDGRIPAEQTMQNFGRTIMAPTKNLFPVPGDVNDTYLELSTAKIYKYEKTGTTTWDFVETEKGKGF